MPRKLRNLMTYVKEHDIEIGFAAFTVGTIALIIKYPDSFVTEAEPENAIHIYHHHV